MRGLHLHGREHKHFNLKDTGISQDYGQTPMYTTKPNADNVLAIPHFKAPSARKKTI